MDADTLAEGRRLRLVAQRAAEDDAPDLEDHEAALFDWKEENFDALLAAAEEALRLTPDERQIVEAAREVEGSYYPTADLLAILDCYFPVAAEQGDQ